ncbi:MAG: extracellular solute-binding protein [Steroidobacteraceae bacterium]
MKLSLTLASLVFGAASAFASQATLAQGGELRLYSSNGIKPAIEALHSAAEKEIGRKISIEFSSSTALQKQIEGGAAFDLAILTPGIIEQFAKNGTVVAGSVTTVASSDLGVGAKAGSAKADVGSAAGMKARLLAAKTVTWTDGGAAGPSVLAMFDGLGIGPQMKPKIVLQTVPGRPALSVASGENELMFAPVSEIQSVAGVQVLGKFPKEFQKPVVMTAGISAKAADAESARKLLAFLTGPKAAGAMKSTGMDTPKR